MLYPQVRDFHSEVERPAKRGRFAGLDFGKLSPPPGNCVERAALKNCFQPGHLGGIAEGTRKTEKDKSLSQVSTSSPQGSRQPNSDVCLQRRIPRILRHLAHQGPRILRPETSRNSVAPRPETRRPAGTQGLSLGWEGDLPKPTSGYRACSPEPGAKVKGEMIRTELGQTLEPGTKVPSWSSRGETVSREN